MAEPTGPAGPETYDTAIALMQALMDAAEGFRRQAAELEANDELSIEDQVRLVGLRGAAYACNMAAVAADHRAAAMAVAIVKEVRSRPGPTDW